MSRLDMYNFKEYFMDAVNGYLILQPLTNLWRLLNQCSISYFVYAHTFYPVKDIFF
jgi:hypothetical protein